MGDGSTKAIEDVEVGDLVLATDPQTGVAGGRMVIALIVGQGDKDLVEVTVDTDGGNGGDTGTVTATDGHPFWVENQGAWVDAKDLRPGHMLRTSAGTWVQVTAVREFQRHQRVHNLTITDLHTYHVTVGDTQALVHNTNPGECVAGTNERGQLTSRGKFRKATEQGAWDNAADGPNGGKLCPTCGGEVLTPPGAGTRAAPRDWDVSHNHHGQIVDSHLTLLEGTYWITITKV
jgi:hypothetical protein